MRLVSLALLFGCWCCGFFVCCVKAFQPPPPPAFFSTTITRGTRYSADSLFSRADDAARVRPRSLYSHSPVRLAFSASPFGGGDVLRTLAPLSPVPSPSSSSSSSSLLFLRRRSSSSSFVSSSHPRSGSALFASRRKGPKTTKSPTPDESYENADDAGDADADADSDSDPDADSSSAASPPSPSSPFSSLSPPPPSNPSRFLASSPSVADEEDNIEDHISAYDPLLMDLSSSDSSDPDSSVSTAAYLNGTFSIMLPPILKGVLVVAISGPPDGMTPEKDFPPFDKDAGEGDKTIYDDDDDADADADAADNGRAPAPVAATKTSSSSSSGSGVARTRAIPPRPYPSSSPFSPGLVRSPSEQRAADLSSVRYLQRRVRDSFGPVFSTEVQFHGLAEDRIMEVWLDGIEVMLLFSRREETFNLRSGGGGEGRNQGAASVDDLEREEKKMRDSESSSSSSSLLPSDFRADLSMLEDDDEYFGEPVKGKYLTKMVIEKIIVKLREVLDNQDAYPFDAGG